MLQLKEEKNKVEKWDQEEHQTIVITDTQYLKRKRLELMGKKCSPPCPDQAKSSAETCLVQPVTQDSVRVPTLVWLSALLPK